MVCCWHLPGYGAGTYQGMLLVHTCCWYIHSAGTYQGTLLVHTKVHWCMYQQHTLICTSSIPRYVLAACMYRGRCWYIPGNAAGPYQEMLLVHIRVFCWYQHAAGPYQGMLLVQTFCWYIPWYTAATYYTDGTYSAPRLSCVGVCVFGSRMYRCWSHCTWCWSWLYYTHAQANYNFKMEP